MDGWPPGLEADDAIPAEMPTARVLDAIPTDASFLSDEQSFDGAIFVNRCLVGLPGTSRGCRETTSQWIPSQFQTRGGAANPSRLDQCGGRSA